MKDLKVILGTFLTVLILNWALSNLLDRPFRWWITVGLFVGFSVVYFVSLKKEKTGRK